MRTLIACSIMLLFSVIAHVSPASAQVVLFDFDNAPLYASLPIDQTVSGITAHLSATGPGYSIQNANVLGFTPPGFAGRIIYPNSISLADLLIHFDQALTDFSIMYSVQELACDTSATMRVTAYMNGSYVGTNTKVASVPGTWPVDTLRCSFPQGFNSVVVHYDSPPPGCQDYGVIYMADNMRVTDLVTAISEGESPEVFTLRQNYPNPFNPSTTISFSIPRSTYTTLKIFNTVGQEIASLVSDDLDQGTYSAQWDASNVASGVYYYRLQAGEITRTMKLVLVR